MSFSENLLEASGFENHYLVNTLGGMRGATIVGRLHAIGRKRAGPIDYILRHIPDMLGDAMEDIGDTAMSIVSWNATGFRAPGAKKSATLQLTFESDLYQILGLGDEERSLACVSLLEACPVDTGPSKTNLRSWTIQTRTRSEKEQEALDEAYEEREERLGEHPIYALIQQLRDALIADTHFQLLNMNSITEPTVWYYRYVSSLDEVSYLMITIDADKIDEEIRQVMT